MTVSELIEKLNKIPANARVSHACDIEFHVPGIDGTVITFDEIE